MLYTDAQSAACVPESFVQQKGNRQNPPSLRTQKSTVIPVLNGFEKWLSIPKSHTDCPRSNHILVPQFEVTPPPIDQHPAYRESRKNYVPIVITQKIIDVVLKDLPSSPGSRGCGRSLSPPASPAVGKWHNGCTARVSSRARHMPIVIPEFAQPYGPFPPTPPDSEGNPSPTREDLLTPPLKMSQPQNAGRTSNGDSSASSQMYAGRVQPSSSTYLAGMNTSQTSFSNDHGQETSSQSIHSAGPSRSVDYGNGSTSAGGSQQQSMAGTTSLSGLTCNVHRCTGKEPSALVGATTTILADKLYVFGGRRLSRRRPQLTADLYELDLIRRHWTKVETFGDIPPPRYFHSLCALGDNKLICYGGMSPATSQSPQSQNNTPQLPNSPDQQPEVIVKSDIHVYDTNTRTWTFIPTVDNPQGRYAHCATVLPSSGVFSSANAPLSAIHHNPSSGNPNQGFIGVALDGTGGAEMVVVGGQDSSNHYIEQISVFNLRSLRWTATHSLDRSCGAYRSVVAPLTGMQASKIGAGAEANDASRETRRSRDPTDQGSSMLVYSNYNFLDVKLELQVRAPDGTLTEKPMQGQFSPPGLRFPNGGVLDQHFVVSGTYLTSSKQEYALWALDLRNLTWSRIDAGSSVFNQGSWNRGVLWSRRNTFVILGNRRRNLVEDYNHRRINFSNICLVELEAFGLYDNPRRIAPTSAYTSSSAPILPTFLRPKSLLWTAGGRPHFSAAEELGQMAMSLRELADMDVLSISGERVPANSHVLARRWGPYFIHLLREGGSSASDSHLDGNTSSEVATLRPPTQATSRNSSITITPSIGTNFSNASTMIASSSDHTLSSDSSSRNNSASEPATNPFLPPTCINLPPTSRSRTLFLPHTTQTIHALLHYLYTSSLPPPAHALTTPQILCSLLQLARPYRIDGLLEAVVQRLHQVMDGRNAAAVFNASAMAAGGGRGTGFDRFAGLNLDSGVDDYPSSDDNAVNGHSNGDEQAPTRDDLRSGLRIDTTFRNHHANGYRPTAPEESEDEGSAGGSKSSSVTDGSDYLATDGTDGEEVWVGEKSCVVGLQKRGLRGLMEGRRMRERGRSVGVAGNQGGGETEGRVGLGIA